MQPRPTARVTHRAYTRRSFRCVWRFATDLFTVAVGFTLSLHALTSWVLTLRPRG